MSRDFGDFQTPPELVEHILQYHLSQRISYQHVLEPTCGQGNFINGLLTSSISRDIHEVHGIELQPIYVANARQRFAAFSQVTIHEANIFTCNISPMLHWQKGENLLVIGNPPWVTNTELETLNSSNLPKKSNINRLPGIQAMTGSANFDLAESILMKLIKDLSSFSPTISLLCKTIVARNCLQYAANMRLPMSHARLHLIDAKQWFQANVDACLFTFDVNQGNTSYEAPIYSSLMSDIPQTTVLAEPGRLIANKAAHQEYQDIDGQSPLEWRQGIKHDAASVAELHLCDDGWMNKLGEVVDIEPEYLYPYLKSSDLSGKGTRKAPLGVILPQKYFGEEISHLQERAPNLWSYLIEHQEIFAKRGSSIYAHQPEFAYFGLGPYTFAPYKVAISGMYKQSFFKAIGPKDGKPVIFDDTCYLLPCWSARQAAIITALFNHPFCQQFIQAIAFWDAKRPITKKLLQRIDLPALLKKIPQSEIIESATDILRLLDDESKLEELSWPEDLATLIVAQSDSQLVALF